jgi:hypothetical protein
MFTAESPDLSRRPLKEEWGFWGGFVDTMCEVEVKLVEDCGTNFFDPSEFRWTRGETFMSSYEALAAAEVCAEE